MPFSYQSIGFNDYSVMCAQMVGDAKMGGGRGGEREGGGVEKRGEQGHLILYC